MATVICSTGASDWCWKNHGIAGWQGGKGGGGGKSHYNQENKTVMLPKFFMVHHCLQNLLDDYKTKFC